MSAVSMLMSGRFHRLLFAPVVLGDFAVLDRAGFHQLHSAFRASARLAGNHLGMLDHRTRIKWRRDGNRVGLGLGYWRRRSEERRVGKGWRARRGRSRAT